MKTALQSLWKYNFTPDVGPFRNVKRPGRWYAMPGDGGLIMVTFPFQREETNRRRRRLVGDVFQRMHVGLRMASGRTHAVGRIYCWKVCRSAGRFTIVIAASSAIRTTKSNAATIIRRAMASYGVFLAACGYEYHGPKGHLGFAPRLTPENFKAPFTAAEGWGTFTQTQTDGSQAATIELKYGKLRLSTLVARRRTQRRKLDSARVTVNAKPMRLRLWWTLITSGC